MSPAPEAPASGNDRVARLVQAFERIDAGPMADLPIRNNGLGVEAVGFRFYEEAWIGVLVTPWSLNLIRLPVGEAPCCPPGIAAGRQFPAGRFDFLGAEEAEPGPFEQCSLLSPVPELASQDAARGVAEAALAELFRPEVETETPARPGRVSRRAFLRGGGAA